MHLTSINDEVRFRLEEIKDDLKELEKQLRARGQWRPPTHSSALVMPSILDTSDLSSAVDLLRHTMSTSHSCQILPQSAISAYSWTWDPGWKEFYTYHPLSQSYIYLSQWQLNASRNVWEHVNMTWSALSPQHAADALGAWDDWKWDPILGEWYLEVDREDGNGERCCVFASRWQIQEDGDWTCVGRFGEFWR